MEKAEQDPDADLDYQFDYGTNYLTDGDTITASTWSTPTVDDGITLHDDTFDDTTTTVWVTGGVVGPKYTVTNSITTLGGRKDDRSIVITIKEK